MSVARLMLLLDAAYRSPLERHAFFDARWRRAPRDESTLWRGDSGEKIQVRQW